VTIHKLDRQEALLRLHEFVALLRDAVERGSTALRETWLATRRQHTGLCG